MKLLVIEDDRLLSNTLCCNKMAQKTGWSCYLPQNFCKTSGFINSGVLDTLWLAYDLANYFGLSIEELFDFEGSTRK